MRGNERQPEWVSDLSRRVQKSVKEFSGFGGDNPDSCQFTQFSVDCGILNIRSLYDLTGRVNADTFATASSGCLEILSFCHDKARGSRVTFGLRSRPFNQFLCGDGEWRELVDRQGNPPHAKGDFNILLVPPEGR